MFYASDIIKVVVTEAYLRTYILACLLINFMEHRPSEGPWLPYNEGSLSKSF